jgi:hypothetical protein
MWRAKACFVIGIHRGVPKVDSTANARYLCFVTESVSRAPRFMVPPICFNRLRRPHLSCNDTPNASRPDDLSAHDFGIDERQVGRTEPCHD